MKTIIKVIIALGIIATSFGLGYQFGQVKWFTDAFAGEKQLEVETKNEDFNDFILRFITDSSFQLDRVKFPLKSQQWDLDEVDSTRIEKKDWNVVRLFGGEQYRSQIYDNFNKEMRDTDERLFCWEGVENGINVEYRFNRIDGLWYLTEFNDYSD
jgi:hypothetical protein